MTEQPDWSTGKGLPVRPTKVVRMGKRETALGMLLTAAGYQTTTSPAAANTADMGSKGRKAALEIYERLGGRPENRPLVAGKWDLALAGNLLIEVDEQEHFNRHRVLTLEGTGFPWTVEYLQHSAKHEDRCRTYGKYWVTERSSVMFGPASAPGDHIGVGSPRWRQRALYDAVRDIWAQENPHWRLARLSMYDVVDGVRLNEVLTGKHPLDPARLRGLIQARTTG